jgi:hypothetical protein
MFEVVKLVTESLLSGRIIAWEVRTRRGEVVGTYQQLGIANAIAAGMNRRV